MVRSRTYKGDNMYSTTTIYKEVKKLINEQQERRTIESCCRSVAHKFQVEVGEVEVVVAGKSNKYFDMLGYNVRNGI